MESKGLMMKCYKIKKVRVFCLVVHFTHRSEQERWKQLEREYRQKERERVREERERVKRMARDISKQFNGGHPPRTERRTHDEVPCPLCVIIIIFGCFPM